jgi:quercetin dioxygenase-like cupin family protein
VQPRIAATARERPRTELHKLFTYGNELPRARIRAYRRAMANDDPTVTNPDHYSTLWENEHVRVLEYTDQPGAATTPHDHPNSVMITLTGFRRRLSSGGREFEVELPAEQAVWLPAQRHSGENIGDSPTHTIIVELKGDAAGEATGDALGPEIPGR